MYIDHLADSHLTLILQQCSLEQELHEFLLQDFLTAYRHIGRMEPCFPWKPIGRTARLAG
jgi:hypothetical protein